MFTREWLRLEVEDVRSRHSLHIRRKIMKQQEHVSRDLQSLASAIKCTNITSLTYLRSFLMFCSCEVHVVNVVREGW